MELPLVMKGTLHTVPSWNAVLAKGHWERARAKKLIADVFLSKLQSGEADCSTSTTSAKSSLSIFADTLASYQAMKAAEQRLKSAKKNAEKAMKRSSLRHGKQRKKIT